MTIKPRVDAEVFPLAFIKTGDMIPGVVVEGVDRVLFLILLSGLSLATITLFPERVVEILTIDANPITLTMSRVGVKKLTMVSLYIFNRCKIVSLHLIDSARDDDLVYRFKL